MILLILIQVILCHGWESSTADLMILQLVHLPMFEGSQVGLVIRLLLILSGDIETNPGPVNSDDLMEGLASLITAAPATVKPLLSVWDTDKSDMVQEWNSSKFTVPVLKEAVAWLQNSSSEEVGKRLKKKLRPC